MEHTNDEVVFAVRAALIADAQRVSQAPATPSESTETTDATIALAGLVSAYVQLAAVT